MVETGLLYPLVDIYGQEIQEHLDSKPQNKGLKNTRKKARRLRFNLLHSRFNLTATLCSTNPTSL
jgi:hypothetical protein